MGHYRSEMGYEAEDERLAKLEKERKESVIKRMKKHIEKEGLESLLYDLAKKNFNLY